MISVPLTNIEAQHLLSTLQDLLRPSAAGADVADVLTEQEYAELGALRDQIRELLIHATD